MKQMYLYVYLISEGSKYEHPLYATEVYFFIMVFISTFCVHYYICIERFQTVKEILIWNQSRKVKAYNSCIYPNSIQRVLRNTHRPNIFANKINVLRAKTVKSELLSEWTVKAFSVNKKLYFRLGKLIQGEKVDIVLYCYMFRIIVDFSKIWSQ